MTTSNTVALPPMNKISVIGIWIETVLYGVNCVMFGLCIFIILRAWKLAPRRILLTMSTILFLLCTIHVGASLRQLLEAFVYAPPDVPYYSATYWLDYNTVPFVLKGYLYPTLVLAQACILIWRLYVIFMYNWKIIIYPIVLAAGCVGSAYAAVAVFTLLDNGLYDSVSTPLIILAWVFGFILNLSVSGAIVIRLWRMGRKSSSLTATSTNQFMFSIYMVIESGAISAVANAVMLALFASKSPAALAGMDIAAQLIALVPLLIVVQVGQTRRYHDSISDSTKMLSTVHSEMTFRAGTPRESVQDPV